MNKQARNEADMKTAVKKGNEKKFLEASLRIGARKARGGNLSRPSIYDGIDQYLFIMPKQGEDEIGYAEDPEQILTLMQLAGISEKQAWLIAEMNTLDDAEITKIDDLLGLLTPGGFGSDESLDQIYVVTIDGRALGAGAATLGVESFITEHGAKTLTVLPSSIHEMIMIPDAPEDEIKVFTRMVAKINATLLDEKERLTDRAYIVTLDPNGNAVAR